MCQCDCFLLLDIWWIEFQKTISLSACILLCVLFSPPAPVFSRSFTRRGPLTTRVCSLVQVHPEFFTLSLTHFSSPLRALSCFTSLSLLTAFFFFRLLSSVACLLIRFVFELACFHWIKALRSLLPCCTSSSITTGETCFLSEHLFVLAVALFLVVRHDYSFVGHNYCAIISIFSHLDQIQALDFVLHLRTSIFHCTWVPQHSFSTLRLI